MQQNNNAKTKMLIQAQTDRLALAHKRKKEDVPILHWKYSQHRVPFFQIARLYLVSDVLYNSSAKVSNASYYRK